LIEFWTTAKNLIDSAQKAVYLLHLEQKAKIPQLDIKDEVVRIINILTLTIT
jgi:hypothetical protein